MYIRYYGIERHDQWNYHLGKEAVALLYLVPIPKEGLKKLGLKMRLRFKGGKLVCLP